MLPFESTLTPDKMRLSAGLAALEMIKNGTTGFVDAGSYYMEEAARVYVGSGFVVLFPILLWIGGISRIPSVRVQRKCWKQRIGFLRNFTEKEI